MKVVVSKDGTKIAYDQLGKGPALIMVSGAFSYRKYPGSVKLAELLAEHFTVINYDRRGRGDSTDTQPYAVQREIEDLEALIDAAGGSAYVWGLSSGAVLSMKAAASGLNIKKLAVHEPPMIVDKGDRMPPADFVEHVFDLIAANKRDEAVKYFMVDGMGAPRFVIPIMHLMPGVWKRLTAVANALPYDAKLLDGHLTGDPIVAKDWARVTMPTLVMVGPESPALFMHTGKALTKALPNAKLIAKKGLGHTKSFHPDVIAPILIEFFGKK